MTQEFSYPTARQTEPEVLLPTSGDKTRRHAVVTHAQAAYLRIFSHCSTAPAGLRLLLSEVLRSQTHNTQ